MGFSYVQKSPRITVAAITQKKEKKGNGAKGWGFGPGRNRNINDFFPLERLLCQKS